MSGEEYQTSKGAELKSDSVSVRTIASNDTAALAAWDAFVNTNPNATMYHLSGWKKIIANSLGHDTTLFAAYENGAITGVLPITTVKSSLFGVSCLSMPFLNYGGVCANTETASRALYEAGIALAKEQNAKSLEFRNLHQPIDGYPQKLEKATFILPLAETEDKTFAAFRKATRNRIRKVEEHNLRVERGAHLLDEFYRGFAVAMNEHGTPVLPKQFFSEVLANFGSMVTFYVAYKDKGIAGVKLAMVWKETMFQIWGGYPKKYRSLLANYALSWEASRDAIAQGLLACDFGRSNKESGPADFKRHFSCEEKQLYWEYPYLPSGELPALNPTNKKYQTAITIWKKLPLAVTKLIGPSLSRHLP